MWKAGLSITGTLLSLYTAGAAAQDGVMCNSRVHGEIVNNELETNVKTLAVELCETHFDEGGKNPFIRNSGPGGYALTITHSEEDHEEIGVDDCTARFNDIVEQCILEAGVWGGMAHVNGLMYEISQEDASSSAGSLDARASKKKPKAKKPPKQPAAAPKPKAKPTPTPKGKATPTPKGKATPTPKGKATPTPKGKATPTPKGKPTPTPTPAGDACEFTPGGKKGKPGKGGKIGARADCGAGPWPPSKARHSECDYLEHNDTLFYTELVTTYQTCPVGKSKRNFVEVAFGAPRAERSVASPVSSAPLERRGGRAADQRTWDEWKQILDQIDSELGKIAVKNGAPNTKITIIWAGGMTGIRYKSRGANSKTADIDFLYHTKTSANERTWFFEAVKIAAANPANGPAMVPPPITNSMEQNSRAPIPQGRINEWSKQSDSEAAAYAGKHFEAKDGYMLFQLYGKMARMYSKRHDLSSQQIAQKKMYNQHRKQDEQDAQVFFKLWTDKHGALDIDDLVTVGRKDFYDKTREEMEALVSNTIEIVTKKKMDKVSPKIKALAEKEAEKCRQHALDNPREPKPKKGPQPGSDKGRKKGGPAAA